MNDKLESTVNPKKKLVMSKEVTMGNITKCIRVREIANGYIISYSKYGYEDDDEKKEHYINEEYEKYSDKNPLSEESDTKEEDKIESMVDFFNPPIK